MTEPVRTCLGCRRRHPRRALVRLVVEGSAVRVDERRDWPGRGAWVCGHAECAERATGDGGRRMRRALRADSAAVTLDAAALRAAILAAGTTGWGSGAPGFDGSHREGVVAQARRRMPSDSDESRGVPT